MNKFRLTSDDFAEEEKKEQELNDENEYVDLDDHDDDLNSCDINVYDRA